MTLLYVNEHLTCYNYDKSPAPTIEKRILEKDTPWLFSTLKNTLIYVSEGKINLSYSSYSYKTINKGQIALIPAESEVKAYVNESSTVFILRLGDIKSLCECFSLDMLLHEEDQETINKLPFFLDASEKLIPFFEVADLYISDGLKCRYFLQLKIKELFYLLRAYHKKEDLLLFFYPLLSNDMSFSDFVLRNHFKVKTVNEFALLANYSLSGFQKRFKKVFGISAYTWMKEEKLKSIYNDITNSSKSFKEISSEYDFSSPSHFNDYCKSNFGHTPGELRKNKVNVKITNKQKK